MRTVSLLALGILTFQIGQAALYFQDPFNYSTGNLGTAGSSGGWSGSNSGVTSSVGSLDGTSLGLEASSGNKVTTTTSSASGTYNQFNSGIVAGSVYYSFLLRVNSTTGLNETGQPVSGLLRNGSASSYYADVMLRLSGGNVEIGVSKLRTVTSWHGTPLTTGNTYLVVLKYEFVASSNNDGVSLWLNPVTGTTESAVDVSFSNGQDGNTGTGIGRCYIYGGQTADIDEIRIGSTWADVTAPAIALPGEKLGFTTQPANALVGMMMNPVVVQIQSAIGTFVASNGVPITLTLTSGSGTLNGTTMQFTDASGKATFNDLSIDTAGAGKQLTASASGIGVGLTNATSSLFAITEPPIGAKLGFATQPATALEGQTITPAVVVQIQATNGVSVASNGVPITITLSSGSGTLTGTTTQNTDSTGKATFNNLSIDTAGSGKQLTASASGIGAGLTDATSSFFTITSPPQPPTTNRPVITQALLTPNAVILRGTNGTPDGNYEVLSATNVAMSINQWSSLVTNLFDGNGNFDSTNPVSMVDAQRYFRLLTVPPTNQLDFNHVGFANEGYTVTGGEGGPTVYVGSESELQAYSDVNPPYIIYITNSFNLSGLSTHIRPNKTVIGVENIILSGGGLYLYRSTNVIIRNLTIQNASEDAIGIHYSSRIWIDHCTIVDSADGGIDLTQESDYTTISWCHFYYTANPPDPGHRFVSLIAANDADDGSQYHITYHHNWWGQNCIERMPSVRFGRVHIFNNYYNAPGNNYCVRTRIEAECRVENNFFQNVRNPWERYVTSPCHIQGKLFAANNNVAFLEASSGVTWMGTTTNGDGTVREMIPGTDQVFTLLYNYTLHTASSVPNIVTNNAGAGKGPFAP